MAIIDEHFVFISGYDKFSIGGITTSNCETSTAAGLVSGEATSFTSLTAKTSVVHVTCEATGLTSALTFRTTINGITEVYSAGASTAFMRVLVIDNIVPVTLDIRKVNATSDVKYILLPEALQNSDVTLVCNAAIDYYSFVNTVPGPEVSNEVSNSNMQNFSISGIRHWSYNINISQKTGLVLLTRAAPSCNLYGPSGVSLYATFEVPVLPLEADVTMLPWREGNNLTLTVTFIGEFKRMWVGDYIIFNSVITGCILDNNLV